MEQGPTERRIIQDCVRRNLPYPEPIANAPELVPGLEFFYQCFMELNGCRDGMNGSLSWLTIEEYCDRIQATEEQRELIHIHVRAMDEARTKYFDSKKEK